MVSDAMLAVYYAQTLVGWLFNTHPLRFEYAPAWREQSDAVSLSPSLPLSQQVHEGDSVLAYFENLLPEGDLRHHLKLRHQTTTVFGLLNAIGGDTASGFTLLSSDEAPPYRKGRHRPAIYSSLIFKALKGFGRVRSMKPSVCSWPQSWG